MKKKNKIRIRQKIKRCIASSDLFFPFSHVTCCSYHLRFLERTALSYCDSRSRCPKKSLRRWQQVSAPRTRSLERTLCRWWQKRTPRTRSMEPEKLTWGVWQKEASWSVSWTDCVMNRSCLEQIVSWLAFLVLILRLLHLMLMQLRLVKHCEMCLEQIVSCETETSIVKCVLIDCVLNKWDRDRAPFSATGRPPNTTCPDTRRSHPAPRTSTRAVAWRL